jgi:hypothetical protein
MNIVCRCKGCGAEIQWIGKETGAKMPANLERKVIITKTGQVVAGFETHWTTCPVGNQFRKEKDVTE